MPNGVLTVRKHNAAAQYSVLFCCMLHKQSQDACQGIVPELWGLGVK
jgi:hypothetical protein